MKLRIDFHAAVCINSLFGSLIGSHWTTIAKKALFPGRPECKIML